MYRHIISNSSSHVGLKYECTDFMLLQRNRFLIVITKVWGISLYTPNRLLLRKGYETRRSTWLFSTFVFVWNEKQELFFHYSFSHIYRIYSICNKFQTKRRNTLFYIYNNTMWKTYSTWTHSKIQMIQFRNVTNVSSSID